MEFETWYFILGIAILLNIIVSIFLVRRDDLDSFQKGAQILIVWLIPFIAAIGLWMFNRGQEEIVTAKKSFGGGSRDSSNAGSAGGGD
jgi:hypothetical protein